MSNQLRAPKGTKDILPADAHRWQHVEAVARELLPHYRYREIRTPIFEETALFARGIGEETDIVGKEMYSFQIHDHALTLRPENTAGVVRAYIQNKLYVEPAPQKLWYLGPMFRYEAPQAGRQRQFHQLGVECLGSDEPRWDAECIVLAGELLGRLGLTGLKVLLNSVGCPDCRGPYRETLQAYLRAHATALCTNCVTRTEKNPLRVLDCKVPGCQETIEAAPPLADSLCEGCRTHLAAVEGFLGSVGLAYERSSRLVRGLDYYTRTVFEITSGALGAQNTVLAGGRYNDLVEQLGGPATSAVGWALGMERLLMLMPPEAAAPPALLGLVMSAPGASEQRAFQLARDLRALGQSVELAPGGKLDKQFKQAERLGARFALIMGEQELADGVVAIKNLATREQERVGLDPSALAAWLRQVGAPSESPLAGKA